MKEEINMIEKNGSWSLVDRTKSRNIIGLKWIFKIKQNPDGLVYKHMQVKVGCQRLFTGGWYRLW